MSLKPKTSHIADKKLKSLLFLAAKTAVAHNKEFSLYAERKRLEGKPHYLIMNNVSNKMLRTVYGIVQSRKPYDLNHVITSYSIHYTKLYDEITAIPETFPVHVSADNRYKLFVNEKLVSIGPTRGDIQHWNFETVDISPFLHEGANIIAAQVWNEGELRTEGHISLRSAFILQGTTVESEILNSNKTWKCYHDKGYRAIPTRMKAYYVGGPGESYNFV